MIRAGWGLVFLALTLSACGWAEWPPPHRRAALPTYAPSVPARTERKIEPANPPSREVAAQPTLETPTRPAPVTAVALDEPTTPEAAPATAVNVPETIVVEKGETVYALSRRYSVSVRGIIEANGLKPPYHLNAGQNLRLPKEVRYKVVKGDTAYAIAHRFGVGQYELARANDLDPPSAILEGQWLRIPREDADSGTEGGEGPSATEAEGPASSAKPAFSAPAPPKPAVRAPDPPKTPAAIPTPPARTGKGFVWPVQGRILSSFGAKSKGLFNDGINIAAARGTHVLAAENGVVAYVGNELRGFGNLVLLKHDGGWVTAYAHADRILVRRGDRVSRGQVIARVGSSGSVTSPQLHFEIRHGKKPVDPQRHLRRDQAWEGAIFRRVAPSSI